MDQSGPRGLALFRSEHYLSPDMQRPVEVWWGSEQEAEHLHRRQMINSTDFSSFTLAAYSDRDRSESWSALVIMFLYVLIVSSNLFLLVVIGLNRSLHEPMYLFLCSLFVNELYGSTALFPLLLVQVLSEVHTVSVPFCFLQVFCVYTYANVEFCNLAVMSYDRYLAICFPLHYNTLMTSNRVAVLIAVIWLYPVLGITGLISLSASLQRCGNVINKVYCANYSIVKLACSDTAANNVYGMVYTAVTICVVLFILYTYMRILRVCFSGSKQTRQRAVSTCTPHVASLLNFSCGCFFEIIQSRFDMVHVPPMVRIFLSLYWLTCQPLFNPVVYGLNLTKIRSLCKNLLLSKV
ncbi:olfactory receptor 52K1-like [Notolabrus celidotus]|uniref:olfactory receptor 52K1-like n=1 Tax=Notolabrus celidotus TaxID=1203425 RepID=UPI00148F6846|nr:olfactory receptor 52K1-like [Notolabrus celidotus]